VIDELNRSNFDRAFGQLFTVLSGQAVVLPYQRDDNAGRLALVPEGASAPGTDALVIPASWRVLATISYGPPSLTGRSPGGWPRPSAAKRRQARHARDDEDENRPGRPSAGQSAGQLHGPVRARGLLVCAPSPTGPFLDRPKSRGVASPLTARYEQAAPPHQSVPRGAPREGPFAQSSYTGACAREGLGLCLRASRITRPRGVN
jgi:hypothetical protein